MRSVLKQEFADKLPVSLRTLLGYLQRYRSDLNRLGQPVFGSSLNYMAVIYLCDRLVVDPKEFYPEVTDEEINKVLEQINCKCLEA